MTYSTKNNTNQSGQIVTQQLKVDRGADGRSWRAGKQNGVNVDVYDFKILDDYTIGKWVNGVYIGKSSVIRLTSSTSNITITIDKDCLYVYILLRDLDNKLFLYRLTISDMSLNAGFNTLLTGITPIKSQITADGNNIVWLGNNNTLYKMDLDGSNLTSTIVAYVNNFTISNNGYAYCFGGQIHKVNLTTMSSTLIISIFNNNINTGYACFAYNEYVYAINQNYGQSKDYIYKIDTSEDSFSTTDLTGSVEYEKVVKFFLTKDENDSWYGVLYENNGADRKRCYKVDLDTRLLTPLRIVSATVDQGDYLEQVGIFSNDSVTYPVIATRGVSGSNGDEGGGSWMQVNSVVI